MSKIDGPAGLAALSICESTLLSLVDSGTIDEAERLAILGDAATAHRGEAANDGTGSPHAAAAALIQSIMDGGNSVRRTRAGVTYPDPERTNGPRDR